MALLERQLEVRRSVLPGAGKGLFTKVFIPKGTRIVEYKGKQVTWKQVEAMDDERNGYVFYFSKNHCIDAWRTKKSVAHFANDANGIVRVKGIRNNSDYNTHKRRCYIEASRDIPAGSEILVAYGGDYWRAIRYNLRVDEKTAQKAGRKSKTELPHHKAAKRQKAH